MNLLIIAGFMFLICAPYLILITVVQRIEILEKKVAELNQGDESEDTSTI